MNDYLTMVKQQSQHMAQQRHPDTNSTKMYLLLKMYLMLYYVNYAFVNVQWFWQVLVERQSS